MTRTRASAKAAGASFERLVADYLGLHVDDRIDRRVKTGAKDRGDIGGLRHGPLRLTVECKNCARLSLGAWVDEVEVEKDNDVGDVGLVIHKRLGHAAAADQFVTMRLDNFVALLTGAGA